jgi:hypothetical protein
MASPRRRARPGNRPNAEQGVNAILADPAAKARFTEIGAIAAGLAADFESWWRTRTEKWGKVVVRGARVTRFFSSGARLLRKRSPISGSCNPLKKASFGRIDVGRAGRPV